MLQQCSVMVKTLYPAAGSVSCKFDEHNVRVAHAVGSPALEAVGATESRMTRESATVGDISSTPAKGAC